MEQTEAAEAPRRWFNMQSYNRTFDDTALLLLVHGCRNLARVLQPGGVDELWIDAPADRTRVGEVLPGRAAACTGSG